jgi:Flp pilus assembly protein TadD
MGCLATLLSACRVLQPSLTPHAETPWVEVRSNAFRVLAQVDVQQARALCNQAEVLRSVIGLVTTARSAPRVPTTIFVFDEMQTVQSFADQRVAGFMSPGMRDNAAVVFAGTTRGLSGREVLFHEYTHLVLHNENELLYPMWYDEGLAEYFSSLRVEKGRVTVGLMPPHQIGVARQVQRMPIEWVITSRSVDGWLPQTVAGFYMQSWLLTHYVGERFSSSAGQPGPLARYLVQPVPPEESERAWQASFGMSFEELEEELARYSRKVPARSFPLDRLKVETCGEARTVPPAEIAQELGWLAVRLGQPEAAQPLFETALRADPNDARAHAGLGDVAKFGGRWAEARPHYARALELGPDDFRNHLELAEWAVSLPAQDGGGSPETIALAREHLARALRLAPQSPEACVVLAQTYLLPGQDPRLGIPHAQRAALLLPSNEQVQITLAQLYLESGEYDAARAKLARLMAWSHAKVAGQAARLQAVLETREEASAPGDGHLPDAHGGSGGGAEPE